MGGWPTNMDVMPLTVFLEFDWMRSYAGHWSHTYRAGNRSGQVSCGLCQNQVGLKLARFFGSKF